MKVAYQVENRNSIVLRWQKQESKRSSKSILRWDSHLEMGKWQSSWLSWLVIKPIQFCYSSSKLAGQLTLLEPHLPTLLYGANAMGPWFWSSSAILATSHHSDLGVTKWQNLAPIGQLQILATQGNFQLVWSGKAGFYINCPGATLGVRQRTPMLHQLSRGIWS